MARRIYRFLLKTQKEVSFIGTQYFPIEVDPTLSPYTTVLASIWDEDHMVGQVNQTEILAWWSEPYQEPTPQSAKPAGDATLEPAENLLPAPPSSILLPRNP